MAAAYSTKKRKTMAAPNWSEILNEVLVLIVQKLEAVDVIRSKAVCHSWNRAARSYVTSPSYTPLPQIPWFMLCGDEKSDRYGCRFMSLQENGKVYNVKNVLEGFHGVIGAGASYGWLAIFLVRKRIAYLVNPFSGAKIQLQMTLTSQIAFKENPIKKIVLFSDPSRDKDFSAAVLYGRPCKLAFYKHGDNANPWIWRTQLTENQFYRDVICHGGRIYALNYADTVDIWDFFDRPSDFPTKVVDIGNFGLITDQTLLLKNPGPIPNDKQVLWHSYLVESMGEVLIVRQISLNTSHPYTQSTIGFVVCKLDENGKIGCTPLQTLPDRALLLGEIGATSLSTRDFPKLQENSIYFLERYLEIYNLREEKASKCPYEYGLTNRRLAFWVVPNPW